MKHSLIRHWVYLVRDETNMKGVPYQMHKSLVSMHDYETTSGHHLKLHASYTDARSRTSRAQDSNDFNALDERHK